MDPKEQNSQSYFIHTMLRSQVIGQNMIGHAHFSNFLYRGVIFSKCSDLNENGLKLFSLM